MNHPMIYNAARETLRSANRAVFYQKQRVTTYKADKCEDKFFKLQLSAGTSSPRQAIHRFPSLHILPGDHLILAKGRRFSLAAIGAATCCSGEPSFQLESGEGAAAALVVVRGAGRGQVVEAKWRHL